MNRQSKPWRRLSDDEITTLLHRVCVKREPIKAVASDMNLDRATVENYARRYELRPGKANAC